MTLSAQLHADQRAREDFIAYCPLCSFVGIRDAADILHRPATREFQGVWKLTQCCSLSATDEVFDSKVDAVAWWDWKRQQPIADTATDNRRKNCLAKLTAKNLEKITL